MVSRLSGMDAVSLHTQSSTVPAHAVALIIIEASDQLSHQRLHELVASSLPQLARFRSRLVGKPLGLGQPVWAEIDDYDPTSANSLRNGSCSRWPARVRRSDRRLTTGAQDRHEPLWEAWSIDGLAGGRWALAVKMSPALSDGVAGAASIWPRLLTTGPHDDPTSNLPTEPSLGTLPSIGELVTDMMTEILENHVTGVWLIAGAVPGVLRAAAAGCAARAGPTGPHSGVVDERAGAAYRVQRAADRAACGGLRLDPAGRHEDGQQRVRGQHHQRFPGRLHTVAARLAAAPRRRSRRSAADAASRYRCQTPIPPPSAIVRLSGVFASRCSSTTPCRSSTDLHAATERLNTARSRAMPKELGFTVDFATIGVADPADRRPRRHAALHRTGLARNGSRRSATASSRLISGPPVPAYCAGAKVVGMHTAAPLVEGSGLNITLISHGDVMDLSVCACPDNVPAVNDIATGIVDSVGILVAAAQESPRGERRSVLTEMTSHTQKRSHARH